ncbi:MAG: tRNA pseudouridine(55) synthase TruB [Gammaproteobacteria bacterium]|nr:tRNA pseudouridine(55) synthase TruB [Gammaproteobacteria bacterium]
MARKRKGRPVNGVLLLDKPLGHSSNHVLQKVRRLYNAQKAGHTGSLDPLASGMLPICFGEATKFSQYLLDANKAYTVTAKLGETTTTSDAEGEIIEQRPIKCSAQEIESTALSFIGSSKQVPSMYSALKHQGQPLYKLARQGIEVERQARDIHIDKLTVESITSNTFSLYVECSKGTYIRNLVEDIGEQLGCGAHVIKLRREWVAHFDNASMVSMEQLQSLRDNEQFDELDGLLLPVDCALEGYEQQILDADAAHYFCHGQPVFAGAECVSGELVKVYDESELFLGIAIVDDDMKLAPKRLVVRE